MKKTYLFATVFLFLTVFSCTKEESNNGEDVALAANLTEEIALNADNVSGGLLIDNGTLISGNAPSPVGTLAFNLDETTASGFQKNGFNITFNAPSNYAGAYIQLKSEDGTMAKNYWNITKNNLITKTDSKGREGILGQKKNTQSKTDNVSIDVDFDYTVTAGTFCYFICIYDTDGNISEPTEVCVEVEAWGGNANLNGVFNYTKRVIDNVTINVGTESCDDYSYTIYCVNGTELVINNADCNTIKSIPITFNEDGTYSYTSTYKVKMLDYDLSTENCVATFKDEQDEVYSSKGNWAYDEEEGKLTLVEFEYTGTNNGVTESGVNENGSLLFDAKATVSSNTLIIYILEDQLDNSNETVEYHFSK